MVGSGQSAEFCRQLWRLAPTPSEPSHITAIEQVTGRRYGGGVDVKLATDLYAEGWTLRQIGAEFGLAETTVSDQLRHAGVTLRRSGPPAHPASTDRILELRDQGLTWNEVAEQVDMTVSGAWSRYRRAQPPIPQRLGRWQQILADALDKNLAIGVRAAIADHLRRAPTRTELTAARRAAHSLAASDRARVFHVPGADADANAGDRTYLVRDLPEGAPVSFSILSEVTARDASVNLMDRYQSAGYRTA